MEPVNVEIVNQSCYKSFHPLWEILDFSKECEYVVKPPKSEVRMRLFIEATRGVTLDASKTVYMGVSDGYDAWQQDLVTSGHQVLSPKQSKLLTEIRTPAGKKITNILTSIPIEIPRIISCPACEDLSEKTFWVDYKVDFDSTNNGGVSYTQTVMYRLTYANNITASVYPSAMTTTVTANTTFPVTFDYNLIVDSSNAAWIDVSYSTPNPSLRGDCNGVNASEMICGRAMRSFFGEYYEIQMDKNFNYQIKKGTNMIPMKIELIRASGYGVYNMSYNINLRAR
ncbi:hypothetical protein AYI92_06720 [Shewanella xiamenensis]|uniref:hypothetical protein n=1 Tax=Shewanella xiamenensis TaxID=332186 RepID=UPI00118549EE|nr:hypothetical protein [Shewanella xiamenensis]TVL21178.1 hypothetical protein AYI90_07100 [Shewanella xiamenensis]TVL21328.1 hypothetical protein AYI91_07765 [Shewanella xiamenensis]TVL27386.1 hypothetical protein AYI92_06720 [Shewanella xiamenensis]TVL34933.1 hypothetical protein AYI93_07335 [Shewanella xiamenensis]TVL35962.1 hypothetical protein AYI95_00360 [Shewanella xiamenensis]